RELASYLMEDPLSFSRVLVVIWVLRSLVSMGDHARNISELVIFLVRGTDVRHMVLKRMKEEVQVISSVSAYVPDDADDK
ncbi:phosphate transport system regulator PhoU, partial [Pseudomonas syringae pv. tagetis]